MNWTIRPGIRFAGRFPYRLPAAAPSLRKIVCATGNAPGAEDLTPANVAVRVDFQSGQSPTRFRHRRIPTRTQTIDPPLCDQGIRCAPLAVPFDADTLSNPGLYRVRVRPCTTDAVGSLHVYHGTDAGPDIKLHAITAHTAAQVRNPRVSGIAR